MASKAPQDDPAQDAPTIGEPERSAVGAPAVYHALKISNAQMGAVRTVRALARVNQKKGFDCPGCAWPDGGHRHLAEFCENGAKAVAEEATVRRVGPEFFAAHPVAELAERSDYWLGQQGRLTHPMLLDDGATHYRPVSWDDAFALVGGELKRCATPDEAVFYTSGRTSNEAAFLYQLFARRLGTNNLPDCSNMCHESSGSALTETIGIGKGSVLLEDLPKADLIIVAGQNPGTNHPRMLATLEAAKKNGARIIAVNPLPEAGLERFKNPQTVHGMAGGGTRLSDLFLQVRLGGDLALFRELNRRLLADEQQLDRAFIEEHTHGFEEFADAARKTAPEELAAAHGLPEAQLDAAYREVVRAENVIVCWAMGLTQHRDSVPTIREVVNFLLLRGNIGRPGAGVCPVRGHSNVQGDRTMGIYEKPKDAFLDALGAEFGFEPPRRPGHDTVESIRAMRDGRVRVFFAMGGNFVSATPDTAVTEEAMRRCRLTVHVSTKLNRSHVVTGQRALILPTLGRTDRDRQASGRQFVTVEDSMGMVHSSRGNLPPAGDLLLSEIAIIARLAVAALGAEDAVPWAEMAADYDRIRDRIARVVPGFEDFNARVKRPDGFALPHAPRDSRSFPTASGKANFTPNELVVKRVPEGRLLLQTLRSHDQYNTTIYGLDDRYRGIRQGRRVVLVHPEDAAALGVADGEHVDVVSEWPLPDGTVQERRAENFRVVGYPTARGCAAAYFPETNVLVPLDSTAETSNTPTSKSIVVRLVQRQA
ncbi:hypothetical protein BIV57_21690 [Mangrovactinospora gilvigrisea]|uniref:FdhF/YdeP family oxidoreductase n=1 Tax=Mangrovactinospora gilvigrisea TaxID=1428644 RepID=A0A1J7B9Q4_9ACTN|nr:FdhF/YdeP family oxidoreductase [Mangrovactinospora gilvigrisea]OIV35407.1 hypothetical protein BIV57_21690 [Mangrovactinospora gilvigrisea]